MGYNNIMQNQENSDKISEARSSRDKEPSSIKSALMSMCSCFMPCLFRSQLGDMSTDGGTPYQKGQLQGSELRYSNKEKSMMSEGSSKFATSWDGGKEFLFRSVYQHANRLLQDYDESLDKSTIKKWHSYSIYQYRENQLLAMGTTKGKVLCKIMCVRVQPSATAKKKTNQSRSYGRTADHYSVSNFDKYWNKRYLLFQRFDEGVSLDQESWYSTTPEAVAEHIAGKIRCDTVLDGFCGAGGNALKLANTCSRVICNDACKVKLKCLCTNMKVYQVDNIQMLNEDFLFLEGIEPDVVFLAPPHGPEQNLISNSIQPTQMKIPLDKIFAKAIKMTKNIVMLLPPNISVHKLGQLIANEYIKSGIPSSTCSIKIEKIFFNSQLKYLAVYLGSIIENEINLNDQLYFIYNYLKEGEKVFTHKKIIRYLRQKYGMISLLNYIFELNRDYKCGTLIEKLYQLIRDRNLIDEQRLEKLIMEQKVESEMYNRKKIPLIGERVSNQQTQNENEKQIMEEEKYVGMDTEKQATLSYYSENSGNKAVRDSKIEEPNQINRRSIQSTIGKQSVELEVLPRANTLEFMPNKDSLQNMDDTGFDYEKNMTYS